MLIRLGWDLTKNLKYDRLTQNVLKKFLHKNSNCIDVGAHHGEVLKQMITWAPQGRHLAVEPIPGLADSLRKKFDPRVKVYQGALSDRKGIESFHHVINAEAYSGLKPRKYNVERAQLETIKVHLLPLDLIASEFSPVDLIKIDVEGGEYEVLKGGEKTIGRDRPGVLFECGKGGLDHYGHSPEEVFTFFEEKDYDIFCLDKWLDKKLPLSLEQFCDHFEQGSEYYFFAISHNHS